METAKKKVAEVLDKLPADATYDEILRELAFERMVERGLEDVRANSVISNDEMLRRIKSWPSGVFHGALDIERFLP